MVYKRPWCKAYDIGEGLSYRAILNVWYIVSDPMSGFWDFLRCAPPYGARFISFVIL
jgi:hypothetical protein